MRIAKMAHEMRPGEILTARSRSGCAFVPVSPAYEWHSLHLPLGTDALIAETLASLVSQRVNGICFPVLSFGLDEYRPEVQLLQWGFSPTDRAFGMNFPDLPLSSEYAGRQEMLKVLNNRVHAIRASGFRFIFIVNQHGGAGQHETLREFCEERTSEDCSLHYVVPSHFRTLRNDWLLKVGGHAGLSETMLMLAFCPDMVDLNELPNGRLEERRYGILHNQPVIEPQWNPKNAVLAVAEKLREDIVGNVVAFVQKQCGMLP